MLDNLVFRNPLLSELGAPQQLLPRMISPLAAPISITEQQP